MTARRYRWREAAQASLGFTAILFAEEVLDALRVYPFDTLGIVPRDVVGLRGILFAPLLHANFAHLAANALPLVVLMSLLGADSKNRPAAALTWIWVLSGLGTWLIGRGGSIHLGASSLIFGIASFLITAGVFARSWRAVAVALLVLIFFGGIFYGVLPQDRRISWEGHLCGAVAGVWAASRLLRK